MKSLFVCFIFLGFWHDAAVLGDAFEYECDILQKLNYLESKAKTSDERIAELESKDKEKEQLLNNLKNMNDALTSKVAELENSNDALTKQLQGCSQQCQDDRAVAGYTYKDELAQATCVALGVYHVYAVRRTCGSEPDCASICKSLGKTCINSLHVYGRPTLQLSDVGKAGLHMYRYNGCGGGCGPNFCCCQG